MSRLLEIASRLLAAEVSRNELGLLGGDQEAVDRVVQLARRLIVACEEEEEEASAYRGT